MKKIGIVSNNKFKNKIDEDIKIKNQLILDGCDAEIISWEDPSVDYFSYDALILKSVWGYHHKYGEFIKWLDMLEKENILIFNNVDIIKNNIRKDIQFSILDKNNIPHVKTKFSRNIDDIKNYNGDYIVKPIISGSGDNTYRINNLNLKKIKTIIDEKNNGIMIQPFMKEIYEGEYAIIFIDGVNTHNMVRQPGIFGMKEKPYELENVPKNVMNLAYKVKNIIDYKEAIYMRVDIIGNINPMVMEVELAEPDLLTRNIDSNEPIKKLCTAMINKIN